MIVITGASSGLGLELAKLYKNGGERVVNISRHDCEFADVNLIHDLSVGEEISQAAKEILAMDERIGAVVNSIGIYNDQLFGEMADKEIERVLSTNTKAPMLLISELLERIKADEADILNVISTAGVKGSKRNPVYVSSKWAERGFTQSLQDELAETHSRVISFCPGGINTKLFEKAGAHNDTSTYMDPVDIAALMKQILDLPKTIQVSEIVINRKQV
jgi:short-subunit dehydrogenase